MNTQTQSSINCALAQANNGSNGNGHRPPIIHQRRFAHFSWCGRDLDFYLNAIASAKPSQVTCKTCVRARGRLLALKAKARAWEREHAESCPRPVGLVSVEDALQEAARQHYAVTERHV
jgi:hypothetical protein